jgi:hypothetical protein
MKRVVDSDDDFATREETDSDVPSEKTHKKRVIKKAKLEASDTDASKEAPAKANDVKVFSNKTLDESKVPPKPKGPKATKKEKPFDFRLTFTNGILLRKFLEPAAHAVIKMRFSICQPTDPEAFRGFTIECHDQAFTLADRGLFECDVECTAPGRASADGTTFCVAAEAFMEALVSSTLKETDLRITRYTDNEDRITFESTNNENDVRTVYHCNLMDASQVDSLDGISIELGFHVNVSMSTLKELSLNAKRCGAPTLKFDLWQAVDLTDPSIVHSKMCIGFQGLHTSGSHDFFISTRKETKDGPPGEAKQIVWAPLSTSMGLDAMETLKMDLKCSNEYDNKKLRLFLNHMESNWVLVHLCTDNTIQPLVLDCIIGGARTKHTVIVAPKEASATQ